MEPHELIFAVTNAGVAARCLQVVAELGVADHIDDHPVPAKELAKRCEVDPDGLNRVLRLLAAHGVFSAADGGYQHSTASRLLRSDNLDSLTLADVDRKSLGIPTEEEYIAKYCQRMSIPEIPHWKFCLGTMILGCGKNAWL